MKFIFNIRFLKKTVVWRIKFFLCMKRKKKARHFLDLELTFIKYSRLVSGSEGNKCTFQTLNVFSFIHVSFSLSSGLISERCVQVSQFSKPFFSELSSNQSFTDVRYFRQNNLQKDEAIRIPGAFLKFFCFYSGKFGALFRNVCSYTTLKRSYKSNHWFWKIIEGFFLITPPST